MLFMKKSVLSPKFINKKTHIGFPTFKLAC